MNHQRRLIDHLLLRDTDNGFSRGEKILYVAIFFFLFTFLLPVKPPWSNMLLWVLVIVSFAQSSPAEKIRVLRERPAITLILLFYAMHVVSAFFSLNDDEARSTLLLRSPLLVLPLSLGTLAISASLRDRIFLLYATVMLIAAALCLSNAFRMSLEFDSSYLYNDWLSDLLKIQSVYFATMISLAIMVFLYLSFHNPILKCYPLATGAVIVFLLIIQMLLASRNQLLFTYAGGIGFLVYCVITRRHSRSFVALLLTACVVFTMASAVIFPKTRNRFNELQYPKYAYTSRGVQSHFNMPVTAKQWNGLNLRLAIWSCGWELFRQSPVLGRPIGDKKAALEQLYHKKDFYIARVRGYNMHSTYLDVLTTFGITGLIVFLLAYFILPLRRCLLRGDVIGLLILATFLFAFATETYPDRRIGCVLTGFFVSLVLSAHRTPTGSSTGSGTEPLR
jgi:O-antigen ligase